MNHSAKIMLILENDNWIVNFVLNILGYGAVIIPAALAIRYFKDSDIIKNGSGITYTILRACIIGSPQDEAEKIEEGRRTPVDETTPTSTFWYCMKLISYILSLQLLYLIWGLLQERIMTKSYNGDNFTTSQFLVFMNRISSFLTAGLYVLVRPQPRHVAPLYKYSYSSLSNILSSWCQYEALKYVSYPTQILAKACKVIPVMLMGKLVSNKTYHLYEYFTAILLSLGVALFLLGTNVSTVKHSTETTVIGLVILFGYMWFDSFTSNWQNELFTQYKMTSVQMMFGINIFSSLLTFSSLLLRGKFFPSLLFLFNHSEFALHSIILSICSAIGQLFIFCTIEQFGPLVFTLIMTSRQALSIFLSCLVYGHQLTLQSLLGVIVVFVSLLLKVYFRQRNKNSIKK